MQKTHTLEGALSQILSISSNSQNNHGPFYLTFFSVSALKLLISVSEQAMDVYGFSCLSLILG